MATQKITKKLNPKKATVTPPLPVGGNVKKALKGVVVSDKMDRAVVVQVTRFVSHPMYHKRMRKMNKFHAQNDIGAKKGDSVEIVQTRPISKTKFWKVISIVKK